MSLVFLFDETRFLFIMNFVMVESILVPPSATVGRHYYSVIVSKAEIIIKNESLLRYKSCWFSEEYSATKLCSFYRENPSIETADDSPLWHFTPVINWLWQPVNVNLGCSTPVSCHCWHLMPVACTTPWRVTHVNCLFWRLTPVSCQRNLFKPWGV